MRNLSFALIATVVAAFVFAGARAVNSDYLFFAGYTVLQFVVLATAWNILGGYTGYVNFGSAAFFALGVYTTVFFTKLYPLPIPLLVVIGGVVSGLVGVGMGYLTLRLRGAFFAIATLALAVVLQTLIVNWHFVGGSRGAYVIRPASVAFLDSYIQYLFLIMLTVAVIALIAARAIERSSLGYGFAAIRDDELAAEALGVPTLKLKLIATALSGAFMGMAGAPFPYYIGYVQPATAFGLEYAVNSIAMPMIGGTGSWIGPLVGAILLGSLQQIATVTISSAVNLLLVGLLLVAFVMVAPNGFVGLIREFLLIAAPSRLNARAVIIVMIATYCFVGGILGIVLNLSAVMAPNSVLAAIGATGLILAVFNLVSAYGLLKLQSWSLVLTTIAFAIWIPFSAFYLWLDYAPTSVAFRAVVIVIALVALYYLQTQHVKLLYRTPLSEGRVMP